MVLCWRNCNTPVSINLMETYVEHMDVCLFLIYMQTYGACNGRGMGGIFNNRDYIGAGIGVCGMWLILTIVIGGDDAIPLRTLLIWMIMYNGIIYVSDQPYNFSIKHFSV